MKTSKSPQNFNWVTLCLASLGLLAAHDAVRAQAPGQDTIMLTTVPNINGGGGSPDRPGKGLDERQEMPIGLKAKIARYTALSISKGEESQAAQSTIERTESAGFNKTCVQDIASSAAPSGISTGRYGPRGQDQVTVLRGDFINVCR